jgi:hypothetical protein
MAPAEGEEGPSASAVHRRHYVAAFALACVCIGAACAVVSRRNLEPAPFAERHGGPLRSEHILSHQPADDCNYVGAPAPKPGDVWMDSTPSGFLLTYTSDGFWRPMCVNSFSDDTASVACRMLGFQGASNHYNAQLRNATQHGLAPGVTCKGRETSLDECASDPDFEKGWSDCRRYPEAMAVRLTCYGDIASRRENHYLLAERFTHDLKIAVRRCGSSQVLSGIMGAIDGEDAEQDDQPDKLGGARSGAASDGAGGGNDKLGKILGPIFGAAGAIGTAAGAAAGTANQRNGAGMQQQAVGSAQGSAECSCSLVGDLRALADMHGQGLLTLDEYGRAKSRLLAS